MVDFMPYDQQMADLQRRQRMAQMLQDQAAQPLESQVAPGGMVVPTSPVLGLAQLLKGYMGGKAQAAVGRDTAAAKQRARDEFGRFIEQTSPEAAPAPDMTLSQGDSPVMAPQTTPAQMRQRLIQGLASGNPMVEQYAQTMLAQKPEREEYGTTPVQGADGKYYLASKSGNLRPTDVSAPVKELPAPAPTTLARLLQEQAGLPQGDPRRSIYENAIAKETKLPSATANLGKAPSGFRYTGQGDLEPIPGGPNDPDRPKPMPLSVLSQNIADAGDVKRLQESKQLMQGFIDDLSGDKPKLPLGSMTNLGYQAGQATSGVAGLKASDEAVRFFELKRAVSEQVNAILSLAKGPQTDQDARRAQTQILENMNDPKIVKSSLVRLQQIFDREAQIRMDGIEERNQVYGKGGTISPPPGFVRPGAGK
jgi:hypothetical protein